MYNPIGDIFIKCEYSPSFGSIYLYSADAPKRIIRLGRQNASSRLSTSVSNNVTDLAIRKIVDFKIVTQNPKQINLLVYQFSDVFFVYDGGHVRFSFFNYTESLLDLGISFDIYKAYKPDDTIKLF